MLPVVSSDVVERLSGAGVSIDEDSLREAQAALDKASGIVELSEKAKYYMISNDIAPTIDGIYKCRDVSCRTSTEFRISDIISGVQCDETTDRVSYRKIRTCC